MLIANRFHKSPISPNILVDEQNNIITDPQEIADIFQNKFKGIFSEPILNSSLDSSLETTSNLEIKITIPFPSFQITEQHVISAINEMKGTSSYAKQNIPVSVFKSCKRSLSKPLKLFIETSLNSGKIKFEYKYQTVIPIHKKGSKSKPENYRPVSMTLHEIKNHRTYPSQIHF